MNKMVLLDPVHHSFFASETLKDNTEGAIWVGPVDNPQDGFSVKVWDDDHEANKGPLSLSDQN